LLVVDTNVLVAAADNADPNHTPAFELIP